MGAAFQIQTEDGPRTVAIEGVTELRLTFNGIEYQAIGPNVEAAFRSFAESDLTLRRKEFELRQDIEQHENLQRIATSYTPPR